MNDTLLDRARVEIKLNQYGTAPATALLDASILPRVQEYRRQISAKMYPLDRDDIGRKIPNAKYHVSRKVDGEFTALVFRNDEIVTLNPGGTVRIGMPWQEEALKRLKSAGIQEAMIVGELHLFHEDGRRERVHDVTSVARQPGSQADLDRLRFSAFDMISVNQEAMNGGFSENWNQLLTWFGDGEMIRCVESKSASSSKEIGAQFRKWVEDEGSEGIVVRSDAVGSFKIKPRHSLDAAVIGFTESSDERQGMMHDLLLAIARSDGAMQVLCRVGGGFSDDQRREMLSDLKDMVVPSEYAEVNSDHVAYQMVEPKWVVEISYLDLISQTTRGAPVNRMVLNWNYADRRYEVIRRLPLCSVISPQFQRIREDKSANASDIRISQVADRVDIPMSDRDATRMTLSKSTVLRREVYTKTLKGELMVRKFLMWKTNKENEASEFPAYVIHYTDFSPNRKNPLDRDLRVSNSESQILQLWNQLKEANIKKGWEPVGESFDQLVESVVEEAVETSGKEPAKKSRADVKKEMTSAQSKENKSGAETAVASSRRQAAKTTSQKKTATKNPAPKVAKKAEKKKVTKKKVAAKKVVAEKPAKKKKVAKKSAKKKTTPKKKST